MRKVSLMTMTMFMRILFNYNLDHDKEDLLDGYEEILTMVQKAGFDSIDVSGWEAGILGLDTLKAMFQKYHLKVSSFIYPEQFALMDEEGFGQRIAKAKSGVDIAAALETDIFLLVPQAQEGIEQYTTEEIQASLIGHWIPITAYAKEKGLHAVIENTPDLKLHLCRAEEVKKVLDAVPDLEFVYDSANMILVGEDSIEYLHKFAGRIAYVHLKDYRKAPAGSMLYEYAQDGTAMSTAPIGTGIIDLPAIIEELDHMRYSGGMTLEFYVDDDKEYLKSLIRSRKYAEGEKL